jgi:hypothetical protein
MDSTNASGWCMESLWSLRTLSTFGEASNDSRKTLVPMRRHA